MTVAEGEGPEAPSEISEASAGPLPIRALDRALAPIRRGVRYALSTPDGLSGHLGTVLHERAGVARALDLPEALEELLTELSDALTAARSDVEGPGLGTAWALLARIDSLVGLPLHGAIRAVRKPVQRDEPEAEAEADDGDGDGDDEPATKARRRGRRTRSSKKGRRGRASEAKESPEPQPAEADWATRWDGSLDTPLSDLLEPSAAQLLAAAGIDTAQGLLFLRPSSVQVLTPVHGAGRELPEGLVVVGGRIAARWTTLHPDGTRTDWLRLVGAGPVDVSWPRGTRPAPPVVVGARLVVLGTAVDGVVTDAELCRPEDGSVPLAAYELPVPDREIRSALRALDRGLSAVRDPLSAQIQQRLGLDPLGQALGEVHRGAASGRRRMAFDEALYAQLLLAYPRYNDNPARGMAHALLHGFAGKVEQSLDLRLTDTQQLALEDLKRDLRRTQPMRRVLTGEVGAGKGRVATMAAAIVAEGRAQVLVLGSDAQEAEQRFLHTESLLREGGVVSRYVEDEPSSAVRDAIKRGEIQVVFGGMELLTAGLDFRRLGLVIAVEHERWGRASRLHGRLRSPRPDLLVLTSVPVGPRVLLTAYSDHDVTVLHDPERHPARITVCHADARDDAYLAVREGVARGEQAVVVFPLVQGQDALDMRDALRVVRALESDALQGLRVGLFHGAMPREERYRAFEDFMHRRTDVLVATAPVEDGPTIAAACRVVVEQADRVEQWRLHRIVGYFSRSARPAEASLVVGELADEDAAARVERVLSARSGFELTEALVKHLGVEATVDEGCAQLPDLSWLDLDQDLQILLDARLEAHRILSADPGLRRGSHAQLARDARDLYTDLWPETERPCPVPESAPTERRRRRRRRRRR